MKFSSAHAFMRSLCAAAGLAAAMAGAPAQAAYPERPINLIVPMPPGGGTDTVSRLVAERVGAGGAGWSMVVQNKPGATGNIGMEFVARAEPDGYTVGMGQAANLAINPAIYPRMPFKPAEDFTLIGLVAAQPVVLVVRADSPYRTLKDLLDDAHKRPAGSLRLASAGNGTIGHMAGMMLARRADVEFLHVPYKGAGPAVTDLVGGQTDLYFITPQTAFALFKAGKLRALAVTSTSRLEALPEVPTVAESGFAGFEASAWTGLVGPANLPAPAVQALNARLQTVLAEPEMKRRLADEGSQVLGGTPQAFRQYLDSETVKWGEVVKAAGIRLD
ncbi:Bug family tripartite tricarboxylate transporter substrate binding protein [Bordetella genomosp. 1]|uniref:LacI family transcriptional regulator n=1 Tax=Bordetella genomosp. 1 TaxID=1395607 RepID=A0ABX4F2G0_9BORD|nr:tripartite tricarboxylate transporter substrate binding protein [Bordetella genomosp. 1]OZI65224.1 LacI family transcriptional regulator [Bordetella genomosp. 1]